MQWCGEGIRYLVVVACLEGVAEEDGSPKIPPGRKAMGKVSLAKMHERWSVGEHGKRSRGDSERC